MDIERPTIATALYDIGRNKWDHYSQSYDTYLYWMERTLSLDSRMAIYTEAKFAGIIESIRKKYDADFRNTVLIVQELEELEAYGRYYDDLLTLMTSEEFARKVVFPEVPEMSCPLYNVIMFNKVFWLRHCVENGLFDADLVIWADAGGLRDSLELYRGRRWPNLERLNELNHDKITFFSHNSDFDIDEDDKEHISLSQMRNIQGTAFLVPKPMVELLVREFSSTVNESIRGGYVGSDEKMLDLTYVRIKLNCQLIKCNWREYFELLA